MNFEDNIRDYFFGKNEVAEKSKLVAILHKYY